MKNIYKIEPGRYRFGRHIVEWSWLPKRGRSIEIGVYKERDMWDDDLILFVALVFFRAWWSRPTPEGCKWPREYRKGWTLDWHYWQRWWGSPDGDDGNRVFFCWREAVLDWAFGKTVCVHERSERVHAITISLPEGDYQATARYERRVWLRPRWPFHKMRLSTNVDLEVGLPFEGKGENAWDCGEDGIYGYGVEGHDLELASRRGAEITLERRAKYGTPSRLKPIIDARHAETT